MAEETERTEFEYTYTYDQFTVFFYGDRVFVGKKDYPVGQCCVDVLNLGEALIDEISRRIRQNQFRKKKKGHGLQPSGRMK